MSVSTFAFSVMFAASPVGAAEPAPEVLILVATPGVAAPPVNAQPVENPPPVTAPPSVTEPAKEPVAGEIIVTARKSPPGDPIEAVNEKSFAVVQAVDKLLIGPVAVGYTRGVPKPVRSGVHNVINNLDEPIVFVNFILQLKPGKALETLARFAINSTIGVAGLIDVAKNKPFNLPRRSNGFADTLGYYGVKPGPYLFLPVIGSTTLRDMLGRSVDLLVLPTSVGRPFTQPAVTLSRGALSSLDERADFDEQLHKLRDESADPYAAVRDYYLKKREAEIDVLRGKRRSVEDARPPDRGRGRDEKR